MPRRALMVGGEAFGRGLAEQTLRLGGGACKVVNHYGPTETTVGVLTYQVEFVEATPEPRCRWGGPCRT